MGIARVGREILVNPATPGKQDTQQIARLSNSGVVVTWQDNSARLGGATGVATGAAVKAQACNAARLDDMHAAMRDWVRDVETTLAEPSPPLPPGAPPLPVFGAADHQPLALLKVDSIAAAVLDGEGRVLFATRAFADDRCESLYCAQTAADVAVTRNLRLEMSLGSGLETGSGAAIIAYAPLEAATSWQLPASVRQASLLPSATVIVLSTMVGDRVRPLKAACDVYGLTGLQSRVAMEAIRLGGIKEAARALGLSYQTARQALADAMKRVGTERLPGLVGRLSLLAFGVMPGGPATARLCADVWGLSERQMAVAGLVAEGLTRAQIARTLAVTEAVIKKELETTFALLNISSGAALARKIVEARAFSWLTSAPGGAFGYLDDGAEPLRILHRPDGGQVAWSDYGPVSGRPVLIVHSSMTTRIVSRKLIRALHAAGYRPIAIDRPGFGLSDMRPIAQDDHYDPWSAAAADVALVLKRLRLKSIDVVARGGAQFIAALQAELPDALGRVVLVNPGPPYRHSGRGKGPMGAMKAAFLRDPGTIDLVAPYLAGLLTYPRVFSLMNRWLRSSRPDQLAARDPEIVSDFYRSLRMFAVGGFQGFVAEQRAIAQAGRPLSQNGTANWCVLLGGHDVLYDPQIVFDYWRELLPEAKFRTVADGGRFMAMTHPDLVVQALQET